MTITTMAYAMRAAWLSLLLLAGVHAQSTSPSNDTSLLQGNVGFLMSTTFHNMALPIKLLPLTSNAGLSGSTDQLQAINPVGPLFLATASTVNLLQAGAIAYISCEPSNYTGPIDAARTINLAVSSRPAAIVLYSPFSSLCVFSPTNEFQFTSMYTTEDANSSSAVVNGLNAALQTNPNTSIHVDLSTINGTSTNGGSSVLGKSPTTAVAMIILYSITGIITALFLIIIVVGAIRAHRHPERYGPRRVLGRPRQSRAKGIARAMLETLPIVKFGDVEGDNKPAEPRTDMELGVTNVEHAESETSAAELSHDHAEGSHSEPKDVDEPKVDAATPPAEVQETSPAAETTVETGTPAIDNGLACSVCVEDFEKGQDVRVLPCKHRFHPECIDPWLLNVSGTCPLCRTDLRPTHSHSDEQEEMPAPPATTSLEDATATATFNETTRRNRRSRILSTLNIGHMRNATAEERLAALRMLRNEQRSGDSTPRSRNKFSQRLSRTFGSRPHSGAGTPRRNSGLASNSASASTAELHNTPEMGSAAEEASAADERPPGGLPSTAEEPSAGEVAQIQEAQTAEAPHGAGSAHTVAVSHPAAGASQSEDVPESSSAADAGPAENLNTETTPTPKTESKPEPSPAATTTSIKASDDNEFSALEGPSQPPTSQNPPINDATLNSEPAQPASPSSKSEPSIAPSYAYK